MIDWSRIEELRDEIGEADFAEVAALFLNDTDAAVAALHPDAALEAQLHYLKGSATTLGFSAFAALCRDGERDAKWDREVDLGAIRHAYADARAAFVSGLAGQVDLPPAGAA